MTRDAVALSHLPHLHRLWCKHRTAPSLVSNKRRTSQTGGFMTGPTAIVAGVTGMTRGRWRVVMRSGAGMFKIHISAPERTTRPEK